VRTTTAPLCEANCAIRGKHAPGCPDVDACRGCQSRQAVDGLRLCIVHSERLIEDVIEAPRLYVDLGQVIIHSGAGGEKMSGSSAGAPVPDDAVVEARGNIRSILVELTRTICNERGVQAPITMRQMRAYIDTRPQALADFIAKHGEWLAAHPEAGRFADALHRVTRGGVRKLAYPSGRDRLYVGDCPLSISDDDGTERLCGTRLYQLADQPLISCTGCGISDTVEQWQKWIVGETHGITDAYAVAAHLALRWMRPVDPALIRQWAHRGHIKPLTKPEPTPADPDNRVVVRDDRNRTMYVISNVMAYAESIWGPPYMPKRAN
jgi:hypothetical protein